VGFGGFLGDEIFCWVPKEVLWGKTCSWFGAGGAEISFFRVEGNWEVKKYFGGGKAI
jgi:hypothetical protein